MSKAFFFCFIFPLSLFAQYDRKDLKEYSYMVYGRYFNGWDSSVVTGTVFFIKDKNKTFLVSAKHVLTNCNAYNDSRKIPYPDTMYVRLTQKQSNKTIFFPIDIRKMKDSVLCGMNYHIPDIIVTPFRNASQFNIQAIRYSKKEKKFSHDTVIVYGFPVKDRYKYKLREVETFKGYISVPPDISNFSYTLNTGVSVDDSINYKIMIFTTENLSGFSGAPIFIIQKDKAFFGGISSVVFSKDKVMMAVKPSIVMGYLSANLKKYKAYYWKYR
jgi:hypothetical protein